MTQSSGATLTVQSVEGTTVHMATARGRPIDYFGGFVGSFQTERPLPVERIETLYPLAEGKRVQFDHGAVEYKVSVLRRERVTIRAGTFDCFVVEVHQRGRRTAFETIVHAYYAPDLGLVVRRSLELIRGADNVEVPPSWELTSIQRGR